MVEHRPRDQCRLAVETPGHALLPALVPAVGQEKLPTARVRFDPALHRRRRSQPWTGGAHAPWRLEQYVDPAGAMHERVDISSLVGQYSNLDFLVLQREGAKAGGQFGDGGHRADTPVLSSSSSIMSMRPWI